MKRLAGLIPIAALVLTIACGQTDAGITTGVKSKFAADDTVKAYQINVDTQDHVVTLSGEVETTVAREQAVLLARQTDGVRDVVDNLRVRETAATSGFGVDVDVDVDDKTQQKANEGADAVAEGAKKIGSGVADGAKKVGSEVKDGAKKVGSAVKDAVTDDDPDSDKDGK